MRLNSRVSDYPRLALTGLVTFFGSLNVAVPFLLDLFRIPVDTFQLFLASGVVNSRFGTLVAAMHTVAVALLGSCAMTGLLRWRRGPLLIRYATVTAVLTVAVIGGTRTVFSSVLNQRYTKDQVLGGMQLSRGTAPATVHRTAAPLPPIADGVGQSRPSGRVAACASGSCPMRCGSRTSTSVRGFVGFDVELARSAGE